MDEVLNKLGDIGQRLRNAEERFRLEDKDKMVIKKRLLLLDKKMDILGCQAGKKVIGHPNIIFDEESCSGTSRDISKNAIALNEMNEGDAVPKGRF